jgi:peptidoglycan/LPS O-acetylase OafA/YrhL
VPLLARLRAVADDAPATVRGAGALVTAQGLVGVGFAVALLVRAIEGASTPGNNVYGEAGYFAVIGAGVLAAGIGLVLGKHWARSPATVVQILLLGVSWYLIGPSGRPEFGIPVALLCVAVLVLLFSARSREWSLGLDGVDEDGSTSEDAGK